VARKAGQLFLGPRFTKNVAACSLIDFGSRRLSGPGRRAAILSMRPRYISLSELPSPAK